MIAEQLPGRTENAVKNRYNSSARKRWYERNDIPYENLPSRSKDASAKKTKKKTKKNVKGKEGEQGRKSAEAARRIRLSAAANAANGHTKTTKSQLGKTKGKAKRAAKHGTSTMKPDAGVHPPSPPSAPRISEQMQYQQFMMAQVAAFAAMNAHQKATGSTVSAPAQLSPEVMAKSFAMFQKMTSIMNANAGMAAAHTNNVPILPRGDVADEMPSVAPRPQAPSKKEAAPRRIKPSGDINEEFTMLNIDTGDDLGVDIDAGDLDINVLNTLFSSSPRHADLAITPTGRRAIEHQNSNNSIKTENDLFEELEYVESSPDSGAHDAGMIDDLMMMVGEDAALEEMLGR